MILLVNNAGVNFLTDGHLNRVPDAFASGVGERIGFYVYLLLDPRDNSVFYVGKGIGNRCFAHLHEARATRPHSSEIYPKLDRIRSIESTGAQVRIEILRHGLTEHEAFLVEAVVIDLLDGLTNEVVGYHSFTRGRMAVSDVNAFYAATPIEIASNHRVALIRINQQFERGMTERALYEATRKWWKIAAMRRDLGTSRAPQWAMAVYGGIVRAVYRIDSWEPATAADVANFPTLRNRWAFVGRRDLSLEKIYLYRGVSRYLRAAATGNPTQNPVRFVNCQ